jgi:alpha-N-arabinofuranosidase
MHLSEVARIKIDLDRTIGEVHPHVFGNFAEHLGRMVYGGIFEEGSPLSDEDGFRKDVMEAVRQLGVSILRWPGGNFVSGYDWKDGIGPKDLRPVRTDLAWNALESNRMGTDEFMRYCQKVGAEPFLCFNLGLGTIDDARHWVEYTNEARHTFWADQRRKNGREAPYKVKYWGLGNEIDGPWQMGYKSAEDYAKMALETAKVVRWLDKDVKLVATGSSNYEADWIGWNRTVLQTLRDQIDYIGLHTYMGRDDDFERFLASSQVLESHIEITAGLIRQVQSGRENPRPIHIAYDEWNIWYRARGGVGHEEIYTFEDALWMGMVLNCFLRHADTVKMANLAQMVNVLAPIMTNKEGMFLQPTFFPLAEYGKQRGNTSLEVWVQAPTYAVGNRAPVPYLDVSATFDPKHRRLFLNVLNRSKDKAIGARIEHPDFAADPKVAIWEMNHADLKAVNGFGDDKKVRPVTRIEKAKADDGAMAYTFPAHSLTILQVSAR